MQPKLNEAGKGRLERSCRRDAGGTVRRDRIRIGSGAEGIERLEAYFCGQAFSPHRHDSYAIGLTISGVQSFRYRGVQRYCLPGQFHVLHPDELHDGGAGTDDGFGYRIVYIDPSLIQQALAGKKLPFVADPIVDRRMAPGPLSVLLEGFGDEIDDLSSVQIAVAAADMLAAASGDAASPSGALCLGSAVARARLHRRRAGRTAFDGRARAAGRPRPLELLRASSALPSAPARAASAPCAGWIACGGS